MGGLAAVCKVQVVLRKVTRVIFRHIGATGLAAAYGARRSFGEIFGGRTNRVDCGVLCRRAPACYGAAGL